MILDNLLGGEAQPLGDGNVVVAVRLQDLEVHDVGVASVLDVVAHGHGNIPDVAGLEVERARAFWRREDGHARLAADEVVPFVGRCVPVELTHGARLDGEEGGGEVGGYGEGLRVEDLDAAAGDFVGGLLTQVVGVGA